MSLLPFTLLISFAIGHFLFLFTKTDFIEEYAKLLRLNKLFQVKEYEEWKKNENGSMPGYHVFLREKYQNFCGRLLGCPFCLGSFLAMWAAVYVWTWWCSLLGFAIGGLASIIYMSENLLYKKNFE